MKIQKMIVTLLVGAVLFPSMSFAQTASTISPTRDELVMKHIASLMEQIKVLQAHLAALKEKEASEAIAKQATTTKVTISETVSKKALVTSVADVETYLQLTPAESGNYSLIPVLGFNIESVDSSAALSKIIVRMTATEGVKITKAYLYQGDSVPLTSALVSNGVATFIVPSNVNGANFESDIPTRFTVKVDVSGVGFDQAATENARRCKGDCDGYDNYTRTTKLTPFNIVSNIKSSDVQLVNSLGQIFKTVTGTATGTVKVEGYTCTGYGCA